MSFTPRFTNLVAMLQSSVEKYGARPLFGVKRDGKWKWVTYTEYATLVEAFRAHLASLGVARGDRVAVISNNRLEWAVGAYATYGLAATYVPMYEAQLDADWEYILGDCGAKVCLVANAAIRARVAKLKPSLPLIDLDADYAGIVAKKGSTPVVMPGDDDVAMFIYTSGTTGKPKGVKLTHLNLASNVCGVQEVFPLTPEDRSLAFLPWAHVAGGSVELNGTIATGSSTGICEKVEQILESLPQVQPTYLIAVPRIWNKIYDGVNKNIATKPKIIQTIFRVGLRAQSKKKRGEKLSFGERIALVLARALVFKKIVAKFGGKMKYACSGAAALSPEVAEFVDNLGIPVYEAYGMTECSAILTLNSPDARRLGSVGKSLPGMSFKLDHEAAGTKEGEGEIVMYGLGVMAGYHNLPEESAKVLISDGGLRSGDVGRVDADGFLHITGRVKEIYKLENGKYVAPAPIEERITLSPYVAQAFVHGMNKPFNVAIVVPDLAALREWAKQRALTFADDAALAALPEVKKLLADEVARGSDKGYERVQDFLVVTEEFSVANDLLTPTLKVKRRNVMTRFGTQLEGLYAKGAAASSS